MSYGVRSKFVSRDCFVPRRSRDALLRASFLAVSQTGLGVWADKLWLVHLYRLRESISNVLI